MSMKNGPCRDTTTTKESKSFQSNTKNSLIFQYSREQLLHLQQSPHSQQELVIENEEVRKGYRK